MDLEAARKAEHEKYHRAYGLNPKYRMKKQRRFDAVNDIAALPTRGSYLDVSTGQGDMLDEARRLGYAKIQGTEVVPALIRPPEVIYAEGHALPFTAKSFEVVTMFDVIEHLIPGDDELTFKELLRVASRFVVLTANNRPSFNNAGDDLHINKRPYEVWDALFKEWVGDPSRVTWIKGDRHYISEAWRVSL